MPDDVTIVFGVPVPSAHRLFLPCCAPPPPQALPASWPARIGPCSATSAGAVIRRSNADDWSLAVVAASATGLSVVRWAENYHLFILGMLSLIAATVGRSAMRRRWRNWVRLHMAGMGLSYIVMLTAFYVDNGKNLPLWRELPQIAFWLLPAAIGIPILVRTLMKHPLARREFSVRSPGMTS